MWKRTGRNPQALRDPAASSGSWRLEQPSRRRQCRCRSSEAKADGLEFDFSIRSSRARGRYAKLHGAPISVALASLPLYPNYPAGISDTAQRHRSGRATGLASVRGFSSVRKRIPLSCQRAPLSARTSGEQAGDRGSGSNKAARLQRTNGPTVSCGHNATPHIALHLFWPGAGIRTGARRGRLAMRTCPSGKHANGAAIPACEFCLHVNQRPSAQSLRRYGTCA